MLDKKHLVVKAGDGGDGRVSFRREKYVPKGGPSGGQGGDGGSVIVQATKSRTTLNHLAGKTKFLAQAGQAGMRQKKTGARGSDLIIQVPVGTEVRVLAQNRIGFKRSSKRKTQSAKLGFKGQKEGVSPIFFPKLKRKQVKFRTYQLRKEGEAIPERDRDNKLIKLDQPISVNLAQEGQSIVIAQGGFGGRGNLAFKSSRLTTPLVAEYGTSGEIREIELELKLLADVGLVGFPSVGKSTLLSVLTSAKPKVAAYPFTTLKPHLGILKHKDREVVIADIPGIIEGAHLGKGLGDRFLKHIEHTQVLVFVLALDDQLALDNQQSDQAKVASLVSQYNTLLNELSAYNQSLAKKPRLVVMNKTDLMLTANWFDLLAKQSTFRDQKLMLISAKTGQGMAKLKDALVELT